MDIPNEAADAFTTPRRIIDYLMILPKFSDSNRPREYIADKVWLLIEDVVGIDRRDYTEDSRFLEDVAMD